MSRTPVIALLDANVLYPAPLRDYLLHLASLGVYEPIWTAAIQDEWIRNLVKARPDINGAALEATQRSMDKAFPGSNVMGYESLIENLSLPDPDDRHVLAAAIKGDAQTIVTANLKDFPSSVLLAYSVLVNSLHPFAFGAGFVQRNASDAKALAFECIERGDDIGVFHPAGAAPTGPKVDQHIAATKSGETYRPAQGVILCKVRGKFAFSAGYSPYWRPNR